MKNWLFILTILSILATACSKEPADPTIAQLSVEGNGSYVITYGVSDHVTLKCEDIWSASLPVNPGDNIQLTVKTDQTPATIYMRVEVQEGLLYCSSLYIEPYSTGVMNYIVSN